MSRISRLDRSEVAPEIVSRVPLGASRLDFACLSLWRRRSRKAARFRGRQAGRSHKFACNLYTRLPRT